jgi:ubiquinone/menaquinone biosynthesis C-methylase UbiE
MATASTGAKPTPERIFNALNAYQQTAALRSAIELDIFTAIGEGADQPAAIAAKVGAAERGVRILCDYLTIQGFLTKENSRYALTQESALFLDRRSPACLASMTGFLASPSQKENFERLTEAVRKGGTAAAQGDNAKSNDQYWVAFARSMAPLTVPSARFIAELLAASEGKPCKLLDVAAGHGMYGITLAKQNPNAQIVAIDWAPVLEVARENAESAGLASRWKALPGSAFDVDPGTGYDVVLLTNILHHFDPATCENLLRRMYAALKPGGRALTLEFVPNEDRVSPPTPAAFSIIMLAATDAGDAYTFSEYQRMFRNAGFAETTLHPVPDMPQTVMVSRKPA